MLTAAIAQRFVAAFVLLTINQYQPTADS